MSALTILRDDAVALCIALGFKTAGSWNKQRMSKKMADLAEMVEDGAIEVEDDADDAERLNELLLQIGESKGDVNVVQELPSDEDDQIEAVEAAAEQDEPEDEAEEVEEDDELEVSEQEVEEQEAEAEKPVAKKGRKQPKKSGKVDKVAKTVKGNKIPKPDVKAQRVRGRKRLRACGQILREIGMTDGSFEMEITPELVAKVDAIVGSENKTQTEAGLAQAWSALAGYFEDGV